MHIYIYCIVIQLKMNKLTHCCCNLWLGSLVVRALDLKLTVMRSNTCCMAIFRFFKMAAAVIFDFKNFKFFNGRTRQENRTASLC